MPTSNRSNHGPGNNWTSPGLPRIVPSASSTRNSTCGLDSRRIATTSSGDDRPIGTPIDAAGTGARSRPVRAKANRSSARDPRNALLGNSKVRHSENWSTPKSTMSSTACRPRVQTPRRSVRAVAHVGLTDEDPAAARHRHDVPPWPLPAPARGPDGDGAPRPPWPEGHPDRGDHGRRGDRAVVGPPGSDREVHRVPSRRDDPIERFGRQLGPGRGWPDDRSSGRVHRSRGARSTRAPRVPGPRTTRTIEHDPQDGLHRPSIAAVGAARCCGHEEAPGGGTGGWGCDVGTAYRISNRGLFRLERAVS